METRTALSKVFDRRSGNFKQLIDDLTAHFADTGNSTCPYCNFGEQWEHDHYLPRSSFPQFTLYPRNLVPICKGCNGLKLAFYQRYGERIFLYLFSELNGIGNLLEVDAQYEPRIRVSFNLIRPAGMRRATFDVLDRHFKKLKLADRYTRQAAAMLARLIREFRKPDNLALGRRRLRRRLRRMATDRAAQTPPNHWESALLAHLAISANFTEHIFS
jgi:hypothetical protein